MAAIDIGAGTAITQYHASAADYTNIELSNPANLTGKLTTFQILFAGNTTGVLAGTFHGSSTTYTCRDYETIGNVTGGSVQTFSGLDCSVTAGDFLGWYVTESNVFYSNNTGYVGDAYGKGSGYFNGNAYQMDIAAVIINGYGTGRTLNPKTLGITDPEKTTNVSTPSKVMGISI